MPVSVKAVVVPFMLVQGGTSVTQKAVQDAAERKIFVTNTCFGMFVHSHKTTCMLN